MGKMAEYWQSQQQAQEFQQEQQRDDNAEMQQAMEKQRMLDNGGNDGK